MNTIRHTAPFSLFLLLVGLSACDTIGGPPDIQMLRESRPLGDAKELIVDLKYDVGELEVLRSSDENLFSYDLQYDRRIYDPKFTFDAGERASMRLEMNARAGFNPGRGRDNDLTVRLTDKVPIELNLTAGVSQSRLDMTGLKVRRMQLRGGVGKTEVTFDKRSDEVMQSLDVESGVGELTIHGLGNAQVQRLELKGGIGHTEVDFTGDLMQSEIDAKVEVGVGAVRLRIPRDADVEIEAQGSFLSNISAPSFERNGRTYTHRGDGGAKIRLRVESGVGGVEIELI